MRYEPPRITIHGSIESLTLRLPSGDDPCRLEIGADKQTGQSDGILLNPSSVNAKILVACSV